MSNNIKNEEKKEIHSTIWKLANELRGSVDGWDFKQYVLGFLFYRYISENITNYINEDEHKIGDLDFDYKNLSNDEAEKIRKQMIEEKGFFILPSDLFQNIAVQILKNDSNDDDLDNSLNERLHNIFRNIESSAIGTKSEENFKNLFDDIDVNNNKLGSTVINRNKKLKKIIIAISQTNLGNYKNNSIDAFGDAYEYLMGMYASSAGKSGGEFFTPQEVSELLTRITLLDKDGESKKEIKNVYDPAAGSGSLLLNFAKILGKDNIRKGFFGQEINITTYNLCRINMFLHDIGYDKFDIQRVIL